MRTTRNATTNATTASNPRIGTATPAGEPATRVEGEIPGSASGSSTPRSSATTTPASPATTPIPLTLPPAKEREQRRRVKVVADFYASPEAAEARDVLDAIASLRRRLARLIDDRGPGTGSLLNKFLGLHPEDGTPDEPEFWQHARGLLYNLEQGEGWLCAQVPESPRGSGRRRNNENGE